MRCILWFLMFYSFLPSYALYLYLIEFWFSLMHLVFSVFFDFEQIIFRILFPWVVNQILVKFLHLNFGITFWDWLIFCDFRWFVVDLDIIFSKLENFIVSFHIKIGQKYLSFINNAVFLTFDLIDKSFTLENYIFFFLWLVNKE